jgi:hypothetical protein
MGYGLSQIMRARETERRLTPENNPDNMAAAPDTAAKWQRSLPARNPLQLQE